MRCHILEAKAMHELYNEKAEEARKIKDLPVYDRVVTLVGNYSQNLALPHLGDE